VITQLQLINIIIIIIIIITLYCSIPNRSPYQCFRKCPIYIVVYSMKQALTIFTRATRLPTSVQFVTLVHKKKLRWSQGKQLCPIPRL
jgi:hypothetical protein